MTTIAILNILALSFLLAVLMSVGDGVSTWWFMKQAPLLARDGTGRETNPFVRFMMRRLGVRPGLFLYWPAELALFTVSLWILDFIGLSFPIRSAGLSVSIIFNVAFLAVFSYTTIWNNFKQSQALARRAATESARS